MQVSELLATGVPLSHLPTLTHLSLSPFSSPGALPITHGDRVLSDYTDNHLILSLGFPHLNLLGKGFNADTCGPGQSTANQKGHLTQLERNHLLKFYDGRFAKDSRFIFCLFDQLHRASLSKQVRKMARRAPPAFQALTQYLQDPNHVRVLQQLRDQDPGVDLVESARVCENLARLLEPVFTAAGKRVRWSQLERQALTPGHLLSMHTLHGVPGMFITISPDLPHSLVAIYSALPLTDNTSFAAFVDGLRAALADPDRAAQRVSTTLTSSLSPVLLLH